MHAGSLKLKKNYTKNKYNGLEISSKSLARYVYFCLRLISSLRKNGKITPIPKIKKTKKKFIINSCVNCFVPKCAFCGMNPIVAQTNVNKKHQKPTSKALVRFLMKI